MKNEDMQESIMFISYMDIISQGASVVKLSPVGN